MTSYLSVLTSGKMKQITCQEVLACNTLSQKYGLCLKEEEAYALLEKREQALKVSERIEIGSTMLKRLIECFCDSPYITQETYCQTLQDLLETFYYFKNEFLDEISDEELLNIMKRYYDGSCHGSLELLQNKVLDQMAREVRANEGDETNEDTEL